ncbi:YdbH domain-containing protein [Shewanella waksmanii]|uniref:YdbH domain-containing protein n=1 Tax=Shewanella waksmanii TaxID=213783 RepID=UPI003735E6C2
MNKRRILAVFILLSLIVVSAALLTRYYQSITRDLANNWLRPFDTHIDQLSFRLSSPHHWHIDHIALTVNDTVIEAHDVDIVRKSHSPWLTVSTKMIDHIAIGSLSVALSENLLNQKTDQIDQQGPSAALDIGQLPQIAVGDITLSLPNTEHTLTFDYLTFDEQANLRMAAQFAKSPLFTLALSLAEQRWQMRSSINLQTSQMLIEQLASLPGASNPQSKLYPLRTATQTRFDINGTLISQAELELAKAHLSSNHSVKQFSLSWAEPLPFEVQAKQSRVTAKAEQTEQSANFSIDGPLNALTLSVPSSQIAAYFPKQAVVQYVKTSLPEAMRAPIVALLSQHKDDTHHAQTTEPKADTVAFEINSDPVKLQLDAMALAPISLSASLSWPQTQIELHLATANVIPLSNQTFLQPQLPSQLPPQSNTDNQTKIDIDWQLGINSLQTSLPIAQFDDTSLWLSAAELKSHMAARTQIDLPLLYTEKHLQQEGKQPAQQANTSTSNTKSLDKHQNRQLTTHLKTPWSLSVTAPQLTMQSPQRRSPQTFFKAASLSIEAADTEQEISANYGVLQSMIAKPHHQALWGPLSINISGATFDSTQLAKAEAKAEVDAVTNLLNSAQSQLLIEQLKWQSNPQGWQTSILAPQLLTDQIQYKNQYKSQAHSQAHQLTINSGRVMLGSQSLSLSQTTENEPLILTVGELNTEVLATEVQLQQADVHYQATLEWLNAKNSSEKPIRWDIKNFDRNHINQQINYQVGGLNVGKTDLLARKPKRQTLIDIQEIDLSQRLDSQAITKHIDTYEQWQIDSLAFTSQHQLELDTSTQLSGTLSHDAQLAQLMSLIPSQWQLDSQLIISGNSYINGQYQLQLGPELKANAALTVAFSELDGSLANLPFEEASVQLTCNSRYAKQQNIATVNCEDIQLNALAFNPGTVISDLQLIANIDADLSPLLINMPLDNDKPLLTDNGQRRTILGSSSLNLTASGELLGGQLLIPRFNLNNNTDSHAYMVLQGLQLSELLEVQPVTGLYADGIFDGVLPVDIIDGKFTVTGGQLAARAPGGLIMLNNNPAVEQLRSSQPYLDFVFSTLTHLEYSELSSSFDMAPSGDATMDVAVKGRAADVTRPIHLNYHHQENLLQLLKSLQIGDKLQTQIEQSMQH